MKLGKPQVLLLGSVHCIQTYMYVFTDIAHRMCVLACVRGCLTEEEPVFTYACRGSR
jgi:hypothetical protein